MGEAANTIAQGAVDGNPMMMILVIIASLIGLLYASDKFWYHSNRIKNKAPGPVYKQCPKLDDISERLSVMHSGVVGLSANQGRCADNLYDLEKQIAENNAAVTAKLDEIRRQRENRS